ncbi:TPA: hypothetical protein DDY55_04430 [Candidatus Falkowbacteria bacterium]|nr:hypothetical protein [Candidatus Falkowbacteria bacterium]HAY12173.1 hypothetical protein [Candidatus Falkowbacteria bacterium]HBI97334.1 hypothetical protein [Candidatus Falkowbacteria bacterium]HBT28077.1 hypothetical protein [Candidatus Falkowbacteria bacterium]HBY14541.1 hypothetical protein [Candidatus Falkowbacteria bacterium]
MTKIKITCIVISTIQKQIKKEKNKMSPLPFIIVGKIVLIPAYFAIKKFGVKTVGTALLKTAVGTTILTATYKGLRSIHENKRAN